MKIYPMPYKFKMPSGEYLTFNQMRDRKIYGKFSTDDLPIIGYIDTFHFPSITEGIKELIWALSNLNNFENLKEAYINLLQKHEVIKWHLINILIVGKKNSVAILPDLSVVQDWTLSQSNFAMHRAFYQFLKNNGAEYSHILTPASQASPAMLMNLIALLGNDVVNESSPYTSILNSHFQAGYTNFDTAKVLIRNGANVNQQLGTFQNTILHTLIANECDNYALAFIELVETFNLPDCRKMNYTLQDIEGKTALLLAVQMRQETVVDTLLKLHQSEKNVGIDTPDYLNRTPLLIAAALGSIENVKKLLACGANPYHTDQLGRGLSWYMNASEEEIAKLLKSVYIEPERSVLASHNWVYFNDVNGTPLVLEKDDQENFILISPREKYIEQLKEILIEVQKLRNNDLYKYILSQIECCKQNSLTVLDECQQNQKLTKEMLIKYFETSLRKECALGNHDKVEQILNLGIIQDINTKDNLLRTPLHYAVMRRNLVEKIANTNDQAYIMNCMNGHKKVVPLLLKFGANYLEKNSSGNSPIDLIDRDKGSNDSLDQETASKLKMVFEEHSNVKRSFII